MLKLIPKYPSFVLTKSIKQQLSEQGFEVTLRTIQRDLDNLSSIMGISSSESPEGLKWCYVNSGHEILPALQPCEALLLCIAKAQLSTQLPIASLNQLEPRFSKAERTLESSTKFKNWRERVKVVPYGFPLTAKPINEEVRTIVYDAVLNQQQIALSYQKQPGERKDYLLNAHGLIIRTNSHYLVATKTHSPDVFQLFKLSKILAVSNNLEDNQFCANDIKEYLSSNATGYLLSKKLIKLELLATGPALLIFEEAMLSENQKIDLIENSMVRTAKVKVSVEFTHELVHFLLGFGGYVKVLQPTELIEKIEERKSYLMG
ncbi:hypothetical protein CMT41_07675 [Colwellia sp. MT41]|nr:hypothetical protein CMT41_07675 [Colwellia sp. MT41]